MQISSPRWLLAAGIIFSTLVFSGISLWKYDTLRYNARDLAIYNQVIFQLAEKESRIKNLESRIDGELSIPKFQILTSQFYSTIQGHNYLGDHVEPMLLLLVPFYRLFPDPRTLLVLQTIALALAAIPLYKITKNLIQRHSGLDPESRNKKIKQQNSPPFSFLDSRRSLHHGGIRDGNDTFAHWLPALVAILWLLHPAVQNANLFEFHSLSFAPLILFLLFYSYLNLSQKLTAKNYLLFTLFLLLSLSIREDVALVIFMLGLLMLWQGRRMRHLIPLSIVTLVISAGWFIAAQKIISAFSPSHGYQYRIYYQWLSEFDSFGEAVRGLAAHILTLQNLEMLIGLLLPLLFLPLLKPKWLLVALPPFAAVILSRSGGSALVWQTHYSLLILPGLFLAFLKVVTNYLHPASPPKHASKKTFALFTIVNRTNALTGDIRILFIGIFIATGGSAIAFGPIVPAVKAIAAKHHPMAHDWNLITSIPPGASVAATDRFLAPLSSRENITLLPLMLLDIQQYGVAPYPLTQPDYLLLDEEDVWADLVQAQSLAWTALFASNMIPRFRTLLAEGNYGIIAREGSAFLLEKNKRQTTIPPFSFEERGVEGLTGGLTLDRLGSVKLVTDITDR